MPLSRRQLILYQYRVDLWRMNDNSTLPPINSGVVSDFGVYGTNDADAPYATSIKCYYESTPEVDEPTAIGRDKEVNIFTLDLFHFEESVVIWDTTAIYMTAGPTGNPTNPDTMPLIGRWWTVQGNTRTHGRRANKQIVYAKLDEVPAGVGNYYA